MSRCLFAVSCLLTVGLLWAVSSVGLTAAGSAQSPSAEELRRRAVDFAGGAKAFAGLHTFAYDFVYGEPEKKRVHHHAYDADKQLYRYATSLDDFAHTNFWKGDHWTSDPEVPKGKELVAIYRFPKLEGTVYIDGKSVSGDENVRLLRRVNDSVQNDRYFAFLPLIVGNPSIHVDLAPEVKDKKYGRLEGFTAWSGTDKATNKTLWTLYLEPDGKLVRTDIVVLNAPAPFVVYWEKWAKFGPVKIAQEHVSPSAHRSFRHEDIRINAPVKIAPPGQG